MSFILVYNIIEWIIRLAMVPVILHRRLIPAAALAWLSMIFFFPVGGLVLYLLVGDARLGRKRRRLHRQVVVASRRNGRATRQKRHVTRPDVDPALLPVVMQAEKIGGMPILGGNDVELIGDTQEMIDRLIADIDDAEHHVHMVFYIFTADETGRRVGDALIEAAKRGVKCRLLVDGAGSRAFLNCGLVCDLRVGGVDVREALPVSIFRRGLARLDLRNHRKLAVIDGRVAYAGSQNIVNPDYGRRRLRGSSQAWIDLSGRFTGPIVHPLQVVFMEDWAFETGEQLDEGEDEAKQGAILPPVAPAGQMAAQVVPTGPSEEDQTFPHVLLAAINAARQRVVITTPYFVPDEPTLMALVMAANRGVEVDLVLPRRSDHWLVSLAARFYFDALLDAGVRIHEHDAGLLHAKTMTVDDSFALLGSSNLDIRSFYLNFELNVMMYGRPITRALRRAQRAYLDISKAVTIEKWRSRPVWKRYVSSAAALFSPVL